MMIAFIVYFAIVIPGVPVVALIGIKIGNRLAERLR